MFYKVIKLYELLNFRQNGSTNREFWYLHQEEFLIGTVI